MIFFLLSYSCVIIHLFLCYRNLAYGCAFMIFIHQVFPTVFRLGNVSMNTAMIAVLAVFVVIRNYRKMYNPQIQISAESETKRSIFRKRDKTKRSKKRLHTTLIKPEQKVNEDLCSGFILS